MRVDPQSDASETRFGGVAGQICIYTSPCSFPGEGNGNPLQYSCLEIPRDGRALWATNHGGHKSQTRLSDFTSLPLFRTRPPTDTVGFPQTGFPKPGFWPPWTEQVGIKLDSSVQFWTPAQPCLPPAWAQGPSCDLQCQEQLLLKAHSPLPTSSLDHTARS